MANPFRITAHFRSYRRTPWSAVACGRDYGALPYKRRYLSPLLKTISPTLGVSVLASRQPPLSSYWPPSSSSVRRILSRRLILILLLIAGISPNPGPPQPQPPGTIVQWNCNGLASAAERFSQFLHKRDVKIAAVQKTKLKQNSKDPKIPGYCLLRNDRPSGDGGG